MAHPHHACKRCAMLGDAGQVRSHVETHALPFPRDAPTTEAEEAQLAPSPRGTPIVGSAADREDRAALAALLARADVMLDGTRPWDVCVNDARAYRALFSGSLGFGEAYMDGWWDCDAL